MNIRYFWLLCQEAQRILNVRYHPGAGNLGDYQTKLHTGAHHERVRPFYVHTNNSPRFYSGRNTQVYVMGLSDGSVIPQHIGTRYQTFRLRDVHLQRETAEIW